MQNLLIIWTDAHDIGIPIIDEQHKGIVSAINSLFFFMNYARGEYILAPTITMIEQYTNIHFKTEEALLQLADYPDFEAHKQLHEKFVTDLFTISSTSKKKDDPSILLEFLKDWWNNHIIRKDHDYVKEMTALMTGPDSVRHCFREKLLKSYS